jgi:hypothetical protein
LSLPMMLAGAGFVYWASQKTDQKK